MDQRWSRWIQSLGWVHNQAKWVHCETRWVHLWVQVGAKPGLVGAPLGADGFTFRTKTIQRRNGPDVKLVRCHEKLWSRLADSKGTYL